MTAEYSLDCAAGLIGGSTVVLQAFVAKVYPIHCPLILGTSCMNDVVSSRTNGAVPPRITCY